jgi:hypothetical protein
VATRLTSAAIASGSALAAAGTAHALVNCALLRVPRRPPPTCRRRVSVLVPARDEEHRIARCVTALLAQRDVPDLEVVVLDDGSGDATADVVRSAAAGDPRLRLLTASDEPPTGWLGKPYACARLAAAATGDVLVFVDADVVVEPDAIAATVALLDEHQLDFVSPYPRQLADGPLPRLVQPLLQWSWLTFLPLRTAERSGRPALAVANGQLLAVTRAAYDTAGGHGAVRGDVVDDIMLARALHRAGRRGGIVDGTAIATCRMYDDARQLADGYGKWLWTAFGSPAGAATACGLLLLGYVVPPVAVVTGSRVGLAGYAAGVAGRVVAARRTGGRALPDALAHPASVLAFCALVVRSYAQHRRGRARWKGRRIP